MLIYVKNLSPRFKLFYFDKMMSPSAPRSTKYQQQEQTGNLVDTHDEIIKLPFLLGIYALLDAKGRKKLSRQQNFFVKNCPGEKGVNLFHNNSQQKVPVFWVVA